MQAKKMITFMYDQTQSTSLNRQIAKGYFMMHLQELDLKRLDML